MDARWQCAEQFFFKHYFNHAAKIAATFVIAHVGVWHHSSVESLAPIHCLNVRPVKNSKLCINRQCSKQLARHKLNKEPDAQVSDTTKARHMHKCRVQNN